MCKSVLNFTVYQCLLKPDGYEKYINHHPHHYHVLYTLCCVGQQQRILNSNKILMLFHTFFFYVWPNFFSPLLFSKSVNFNKRTFFKTQQ